MHLPKSEFLPDSAKYDDEDDESRVKTRDKDDKQKLFFFKEVSFEEGKTSSL